jgi:hypothetical protein
VRTIGVLVVAAVLTTAIGCSKTEKLIEVRGKVFIGTEPVKGGTGYVTFHPDASKGNKSLEEAVGEIQPDGTYVLSTREQAGVALGWYHIAVNYSEVLDPQNPYVTKWLMPDPKKFGDWQRSGLAVEVVADPQPGHYDIKLPPVEGGAK